jgi:ABC-type branched-subunit amino acid transport system substrate-binding protein
MVIVPLSAPSGNLPYTVEATKAAAARINRTQGGLGGRPITVVPCDTQNTATGAQACARQAISLKVDSVFEQNAFDAATRAILTPAGIPTIGSVINSAYTDPLDFPTAPPVPINPGGAATLLTKFGYCKHIAFASSDVSVTRTQFQTMKLFVNRVKPGALAGGVFFPLFTADYATPALQIKQMGADCVYDNNVNTGGIAFAKTLAQLGADPHYVVSGGNFSAFTDLPQFPNAGEGDFLVNQFPIPDPGSKLAYERLYFQDMAAAGFPANDSNTLNPAAMAFWIYTNALKALSKTVKGSVTTQSMIAAAKKAKTANIDVLGIFKWNPGKKGPAAFPNASNGTLFMYQLRGGKPVQLKQSPINVYKTTGIGR